MAPLSSYSAYVIHMVEKELSPDRMLPPIQTENLLSGGAMTLIFMLVGARVVTSFESLSAIPGYMVVPPERTMLAYKSFLTSISAFMIDL